MHHRPIIDFGIAISLQCGLVGSTMSGPGYHASLHARRPPLEPQTNNVPKPQTIRHAMHHLFSSAPCILSLSSPVKRLSTRQYLVLPIAHLRAHGVRFKSPSSTLVGVTLQLRKIISASLLFITNLCIADQLMSRKLKLLHQIEEQRQRSKAGFQPAQSRKEIRNIPSAPDKTSNSYYSP